MDCRGKITSYRDQAPSPFRSLLSFGRLIFCAVLVALCAGVASGSCITSADDTVHEPAVVAGLLSAGIALAVGLLFLIPLGRWPIAKLYVVIGPVSYVAGMFGSWFIVVFPALIAIAISIAAGVAIRWLILPDLGSEAHRVAAEADTPQAIEARAGSGSWGTALLSGVTVFIAAMAFVLCFWVNFDFNPCFFGSCPPSRVNAVPFAIASAVITPAIAAGGAWFAWRTALQSGKFPDRDRLGE